jgi:hypothetical protein
MNHHRRRLFMYARRQLLHRSTTPRHNVGVTGRVACHYLGGLHIYHSEERQTRREDDPQSQWKCPLLPRLCIDPAYNAYRPSRRQIHGAHRVLLSRQSTNRSEGPGCHRHPEVRHDGKCPPDRGPSPRNQRPVPTRWWRHGAALWQSRLRPYPNPWSMA